MAPLPSPRVSRSARPLVDCGVDYAEPIQVRMTGGRGHKSHPCYIAVFVCFAVKAVHLEVVTDDSSEAFIAALKRFISRRELPAWMHSDRGTRFQVAARIMHDRFVAAVAAAPKLNGIPKLNGNSFHPQLLILEGCGKQMYKVWSTVCSVC